ncbi:hypothetical protein DFP72DRAFT_868421 [Ephemerocybe angulata]|uniref:DUF6533 domain-containing protein n=1 Tax=Ephemerocybe angulata TaxID=980116 RepID=A0A8H6MHN4_9AGAR|nr:hypothetical protein DFP72DRAFT_868421 [Tulosesus angulatus]
MAGNPDAHFVQQCIQYSSLALIYYDYLLTLDREIKYVWKRPFHILTVMFFLCRYALVSNTVYYLGVNNMLLGISCDTAYTVSASVAVFGRIAILVVIGVRTCSLYQNNKLVIALFAALGTLVAIAGILHVPHVSCAGTKLTNNSSLRLYTDLLAISTMAFELLSTAFIVASCVRHMKSVGLVKAQTHSLVYLMLKEGLLYTGLVTVLTTTAVFLNYSAPLGSFFQRLLNAITMPLSGMMMARFILHVREWSAECAGDCLAHDLHITITDHTVDFCQDPSSMGVDTVNTANHAKRQSENTLSTDGQSLMTETSEREDKAHMLDTVTPWKLGGSHATSSMV